jgi:hypothetical protein
LDKIFAKGRGSHLILTPGIPLDIDVEPENVVNAILPLSEGEKSYIFNISPISGYDPERPDLKVYMSLYFKEPEEYRCDKFV